VWRLLTHPGTFHALVQAVITAATGGGWSFQWPEWAADSAALGGGGAISSASSASRFLDASQHGADSDASTTKQKDNSPFYYGAHPDPYWDRYISAEKELAFFKARAIDGAAEPGASAWEKMMDKDLPGRLKYTAWRRTLPDGKTEYKSVTIAPDAQPEEVMDLFLADDFRREWDPMVIQSSVLEQGDYSKRQQVVRWVRRFPFAFLSDREYAIGRCVVREPAAAWRPSAAATPDASVPSLDQPTRSKDVLYGLTRSVRHPREDRTGRVVRMDVFWSHWRSRGVPCPWGTGAVACETVLLHHEQFKIPENLARFAVRHGMWGFVRSLGTKTAQFVQARRERGVGCEEQDPLAYGAGCAANPPTAEAVARAEAEEAALAAAAAAKSGGKGASRQGSLQLPSPAPEAPEVPEARAPPQKQLARAASVESSVGAASDEGERERERAAERATGADPAFVSWAHSTPVVSRLRSALPSAPPGAVHIHHSLSNASVSGLATVPSMVWSKALAHVGSFGAGLAALAAAGGGVGGGGAADADGADSVVDFGAARAGDNDDDALLDGFADASPTRRGGRDQGSSGGLASPDAVVSVRPSAAGGGRVVSFAGANGANKQQQQQQQQQLRLASASLEAVQREQEQERQRQRRRRAAAAVLAAGAIALAVGGGGSGGVSLRGERRQPKAAGVVVAALPSPAEEQRRRRERQRQHRELRSCAAAEEEREKHGHRGHRKASPAPAPPLRSFPPLTSFPL
jgi:hypothetical protein